MVKLLSRQVSELNHSAMDLLDEDEFVVIVEDSPEIVVLLSRYMNTLGLRVLTAGNATELYTLLETSKVALILLDIGLPDKDGIEILKDLVPRYPDLGIIMVTGSTDLATALDCLRDGADDYLTKPVRLDLFNHVVTSTLQKRRLAIENRTFQRKLEATNYRTQFLHRLNLKMNTVYLNNVELTGILQAILVGITSEEGLRFNRAFLALLDEDDKRLIGRLALGPACREEAVRVWDAIRENDLNLQDIINRIQSTDTEGDEAVSKIARQLQIPITEENNVLIASCLQKKTIVVNNGRAEHYDVPEEMLKILNHDTFAVVPLLSPSRSLGVILVDNFVTRKPITSEDLHSLEVFASQASLAIEHSHLYEDMMSKIDELEEVTQELELNKDLLVASERYSAVGHMSAQLVHIIRNPVTSIGGTARMLARKIDDGYILNFLNLIRKEAAKIEATLEELFSFVEETELNIAPHSLYPLLRRSVMIFYTTMKKSSIRYNLDLPGQSPLVMVDGGRLRQVFLQLVKNGIEAMPDGGELTVECRATEAEIVVRIIDTGRGTGGATLSQLTDPFFTTKTYGTGMGLTLVQKIIDLHHGKFSLEHKEGNGVIATVTLPKEVKSDTSTSEQ
ncbi:response regulator [Desulfosediminicola ganghwensis]|uniref:response regulator n=1 Tax=Desulfosediminicola ganghwensis TaxID=2569540 RepID=UPI0010AB70D5|nr:response regulator [Desulfosediminicola ganghwensis]